MIVCPCVVTLCSKERFVEHSSHSPIELIWHNLVQLLPEWDVASCWPAPRTQLVTYQWCPASGFTTLIFCLCVYFCLTYFCSQMVTHWAGDHEVAGWLLASALPGNNLVEVVHTHVHEQYNVVLVKGQWRSAAGKVTI